MKKLGFFLFSILFSLNVFAQATVRKVPFLPYIGAGGEMVKGDPNTGKSGGNVGEVKEKSQTTEKKIVKIAFRKGSTFLNGSAKSTIKEIEKTCGDNKVYISGYYSRKVSQELAKERMVAVKKALEDLGLKKVKTGLPEFRNDSEAMININEIIVSY